ncbi:hypothetical protein K469DRAFT_90254 [Zopfia rhizophila CBS 207.26]|uniref:Uncharacterized protein n=1 Tax=Zopfia rhizophila CBS 207.26 TaxID=1314779 RepID=A0A6A6EE75_9PEZI|nr:hypothetical protein K469DRAFT_90254 [Zopfia rhizophila CBS 207.26]
MGELLPLAELSAAASSPSCADSNAQKSSNLEVAISEQSFRARLQIEDNVTTPSTPPINGRRENSAHADRRCGSEYGSARQEREAVLLQYVKERDKDAAKTALRWFAFYTAHYLVTGVVLNFSARTVYVSAFTWWTILVMFFDIYSSVYLLRREIKFFTRRISEILA